MFDAFVICSGVVNSVVGGSRCLAAESAGTIARPRVASRESDQVFSRLKRNQCRQSLLSKLVWISRSTNFWDRRIDMKLLFE